MLFKCLRNAIFTIILLLISQASFAFLPEESEDSGPHSITSTSSHSWQSQKTADLQLIITATKQVENLTDAIENDLGEDKFSESLAGLGKTLKDLSWNMKDSENIRNRHGYKSRYEEKGNQRNTTGAQIDFETLEHLGLVAKSSWNKYLYIDKIRMLFSLGILKEKLVHIGVSENVEKSSSLPTSHNIPIGILLKVSAYVHDLKCLRAMRGFLEEIFLRETRELDYTQAVNRFSLAYLFVQMGETAKELSSFLKPETNKKNTNKDGLKYFFKQLGEYRQFIKNDPRVVILQHPSLISRYNRLIVYSNDIMGVIGSIISCLEKVTAQETGDLVLNQLNKIYTEDEFVFTSKNVAGDSSLREISEGLNGLDSLSEDDHQIHIDELGKQIIELEKREGDIASRRKHLMTVSKETAGKAVKPTSLFERLHSAFHSRKSPVKQFMALYNKNKASLQVDMPDPLEDPIVFEAELRKIIEDDARVDDERKDVQALSGVFAKCKMANVKKLVEEFKEASAADVPLNNLEELANFLSNYMESSSDDQNNKSAELAKERSDLDREAGKIKKELADSRSRLESLEEELELLRKYRTRKKSKLEELVQLPVDQHQSEPVDQDCASNHASVDDILRVYAVLATFEDQQSRVAVVNRASAMAVGFLGEYYKRLFENDKLMISFFIERSPVAASMVSTKVMRNAQVMHNAKEFEPHHALSTLDEHVKPWEREMFYLREYCAARQLDMKSYLAVQPVQRRVELESCHYTSAEESLFLTNITLYNLLHFMRPYIALEFIKTHDLLSSDDSIRASLFVKYQILKARVYQQIGDAASLAQAIDILTFAERRLHGIDCEHDKEQTEKMIKFDKAQLLMLQGEFEEAAKTTSAFLLKPDLELGRVAQMLDMIAKLSSNCDFDLKPVLGSRLEPLAKVSYFDVFFCAQQLCAYYTSYGDYKRASYLANFMERIFKTNESDIKSRMGQGYESIRGMYLFVKGVLLYNQGIAARNIDFIQKSARVFEEMVDYQQRIQPEAELTKDMWYRVARSWLFIEASPDKAGECFAKSGAFVSETELDEGEDVVPLIGKLLSHVYGNYLKQHFSADFLRENVPDVYNIMGDFNRQDLIDEMKILIRRIHLVYKANADRFIAVRQFGKAKKALRFSSLASHIVRFADRVILETSQQTSQDPCSQAKCGLYAVAPLWNIPSEAFFEAVAEFAYQRETSNSPLQITTGQFMPVGIFSSILGVIGRFFEQNNTSEEGRIVKIATSTLMKLYERVLLPRNHLHALGYDETNSFLNRFQLDLGASTVLINRIQEIIELKHSSYWEAFWHVTEPEIQLNERLRNPFRKWGLLCGAKLLAAINSGKINMSSSPISIVRILLNDSIEKAVLSMVEAGFCRVEFRDAMSLKDHIDHHVTNPMFDLRLQFFVIPPESEQH